MNKMHTCSEMNKKTKRDDSKSFNQKTFKDSMMTVKGAMSCFDICRTTVYNWEKELILIPTRIGRRVYYTLNQEKLNKKAINEEV